MKLHHLALAVSDSGVAEKFYHEILELPVIQYQQDDQGRPRAVWMKMGEGILMLEISSTPFKEKSNSWPVVAFEISAKERSKWKKILEEKGVSIESESPFSLYFRDPSGNRLALSHYPESISSHPKSDFQGKKSFRILKAGGYFMRNPQFKEIKPNYRKRVLDITLVEGRKRRNYQLPFSVFYDHSISCGNPFVSIKIDKEVNNQAAFFILKDGTHGDFPSDLVLYYCDPAYE